MKVIIVGSGPAGLAAARWLLDNGDGAIEVQILEARNRIGGRVYTAAEHAAPSNSDALGLYDIGAGWLHDPMSNPLYPIAQRIGVPLLETDQDEDLVFDLSGKRYSEREVQKRWQKFEHTLFSAVKEARAKQSPTSSSSSSMEDILSRKLKDWHNDPLLQFYASGMDFELGAPLSLCSATECMDKDWLETEVFLEQHDPHDDFIFPRTGFMGLLQGLQTGHIAADESFFPISAPLADASFADFLPHYQKEQKEKKKAQKGHQKGSQKPEEQSLEEAELQQPTLLDRRARRPIEVVFEREVVSVEQLDVDPMPPTVHHDDPAHAALPIPPVLSASIHPAETRDISESGELSERMTPAAPAAPAAVALPAALHRCRVRAVRTAPSRLNCNPAVYSGGDLDSHRKQSQAESLPPLAAIKEMSVRDAGFTGHKGQADGAQEAQGAQEEQECFTYEADAVLVTVPLGVLKSGSIHFTPLLSPAKQRAIQQTGFGNVVKVVLEFPWVFWPKKVPFLGIADSSLIAASSAAACGAGGDGSTDSGRSVSRRGLLSTFLNGYFVAKKNVLVGYGLGEAANLIDQMSDSELLELALLHVSSFATSTHQQGQQGQQGHKGVPAASQVRMVRTRWAQDPFSCGAYSHWAPGNTPGMRKDLAAKEGAALWFAGEALHESSMWSCSVQGAWLSGLQAAVQIKESLVSVNTN